MTIVYVYTALTTMGGADRVVTEKMNYLADVLGHTVYVLTDSQCGRPPVFPLSKRVQLIDLQVDFDEQYHHGFLLRGYWYVRLMRQYRHRLDEQLSQIHPDVIVCTFGREAALVDLFCRHAPNVVAEVHTTRGNMRAIPLLQQRGGLYRLVATYIRHNIDRTARRFDHIVVLNEHEREAWAPVRHVDVIPNALTLCPSQAASLTKHRVIFVGRAEYEKGPDRMLNVWSVVARQHPDWELHLFSVGTLLTSLQAQARQQGIEGSVHFRSPSSNIEAEYMESAVCAMTSRYEGFGMVLLEAMACGIPCVAYRCPYGPASIIHDGEDGFLVPDGDSTAFVQRLAQLMADPSLRQQMGQRARANIQRYRKESIMQQWIDLFSQQRQSSH